MPTTDNNSLAAVGVPVYGFFRAMVIANNDPENRGRVKLFSPSVASSLITRFKLDPGQYVMRFPGDSINGEKELSSLVDSLTGSKKTQKKFKNFTLQQLHAVVGFLDWVDQASPLIGSGTIGLLNAGENNASISDTKPEKKDVETGSPRYVSNDTRVSSDKSGPGPVNPYGGVNKPAGYVNAAKGMFSIPRVGSNVWVFFEEGDVTRPIYFAYSYSSTEFKTINNDIHRPHNYENTKNGESFYTGKSVWCEKGGVVEIVNTDSFEKVRISDHKGNTVILSKTGISLISTSNLDINVAGNVFFTVGGSYSLKVNGEHHSNAIGHGHEYHGNVEKSGELHKQWIEKSQPLRDAFTLPKEVPKLKTTVVKDFKKKTPNNKFCFPKILNFKLPPGLDPKVLLDKINKALAKIEKVVNLPLQLIGDASEAVSEIMNLLKNPFDFLLKMLKDRIKLLNIKLCNEKKK